jgi:hypothetical protein
LMSVFVWGHAADLTLAPSARRPTSQHIGAGVSSQ